MIKEIIKAAKKNNIDLYSALDFEEAEIINQRKISKLNFIPKSVLLFLFPYYSSNLKKGNISMYASPKDYHLFADVFLRSVTDIINEKYNAISYCDASPINERKAAKNANLGDLGDNGLLLTEKYGSYIFIGEIITDMPFEMVKALKKEKEISLCLHCDKCRQNCPSGYLSNKKVNTCISAITQSKSELTDNSIEIMKKIEKVWGCDECQIICPVNKNIEETKIEYFKKDIICSITKELLSNFSDEEFSERAFSWKGKKILERNLTAVYGDHKQ